MTRGYKGLEGVTGCYLGLRVVAKGFKWLREVTEGYRRIEGLQGVKWV